MKILEYNNPKDYNLWMEVWELTSKEIYANPNYVNLYSSEKEEACCILYESSNGNILYPFMRRVINTEYYDIITPYGYGGLVYWNVVGDLKSLLKKFYF